MAIPIQEIPIELQKATLEKLYGKPKPLADQKIELEQMIQKLKTVRLEDAYERIELERFLKVKEKQLRDVNDQLQSIEVNTNKRNLKNKFLELANQ